MANEEPSEDDQRRETWSLRRLLAHISHNTEPPSRKRPDEESGRREVRGD